MERQTTIHLLSEETINQIAAGEVIEGPPSVVKELIENALDAQATSIQIEIVGGGLSRIRISDDGVGMSDGDARLCLKRHATSKIREAADLFSIFTNGFRGEALAAISSISKVSLCTALEGELGIAIEIEGGIIVGEKKMVHKRGTTIEVRSLFYNTPARKAFQKRPSAISAEIFRLVSTLSLGHPFVSFSLISNGNQVLYLPCPSSIDPLEARAREVLGKEFVATSTLLDEASSGLQIKGMLADPRMNRPNRMGQYLFLNRRAISCDLLSDAVRAGYGTRLDERRYPLFVLHMQVAPELIDINVHPQKLQVRIKEEEHFYQFVAKSVANAFALKQKQLPREAPQCNPLFFQPSPPLPPPPISLRFEEEGVSPILLPLPFDSIEPIGLFHPFLLVQEEERLVFIDLEGASARIFFEELIQKKGGSLAKQQLLIPLPVAVTAVEKELLLTQIEAIKEMGISLCLSPSAELVIDSLSPELSEEDALLILDEIGNRYATENLPVDQMQQRHLFARIASRYAKRKKGYSLEEGISILRELKRRDYLFECPKGNPIKVSFDHDQIKHLFRQN